MTTIGWAIFACGLFACDIFSTLQKKPEEDSYQGAQAVGVLMVLSIFMMIVSSIVELRK